MANHQDNKGEIINKILRECILKTDRLYVDDKSFPAPNNPTISDIINWNIFRTYTNLDLGSIVVEMIDSQMIEERSNNRLHTVKLGYEILAFGGYDNYVKHEKLKRTKEMLQYKLLWPSFFVTLVSVGVSIYLGLTKQKIADTQEQQAKQILLLESKVDSVCSLYNTLLKNKESAHKDSLK